MRKLIFICALLLSCACVASAQNNRAFKKGYQGNIELGNYFVVEENATGVAYQLTTTQGFRSGNGMYYGFGIGVAYNVWQDNFFIPVFLEAKYNFIDAKVSPFMALRAGAYAADGAVIPFMNVSTGVDLKRFAFRVGYEAGSARSDIYTDYHHFAGHTYEQHQRVFCSIAYKF